MDNPAKLAI